jgi:hypothetical protein
MNIIERVFAAPTGTPLGTIGGEGLGPMGNLGVTLGPADGAKALTSVTNVVSSIIGLLTVIAGIWFIFMFLIGGYTWMTSMGDRDRIVNAIIGLVIVVAGWGVLALVGQFFGWDILITDPAALINQIKFAQ